MSVVEWNDRFAVDEYVFGKEPNEFLVREIGHLAPGGLVLCVSDGEGRNGVWLAERGFRVHAIDAASVALQKSKELAAERGVDVVDSLEALVASPKGAIFHEEADIYDWVWPIGEYDGVIAIFIQFVTPDRHERVFNALTDALRPGGVFLLEGYHTRQLNYRTGGPPNIEQLYTVGMLNRSFPTLRIESLVEYDEDISEGELHNGRSALVDLVGVRLAI